MRTVSVRIRTTCSECGGPLPLNAMVPRLACPACSGHNALSDAFWAAVLGDSTLETSTIITEGREVALEVGRADDPACAACGTAIPLRDALANADAGGIACTGCGTRTLLRVPPRPWVLSGYRLFVGEDELRLPGAPAAEPARAAAPIAFHCPTCGGVLPVDGSRRVVQCQYCSSSAYLPDDLWHVFHPVALVRPWYLLHERGARKRARHEAQDPATPAERLAELSEHMDYEVREAVVRHPRTPGPVLLRLVRADHSLGSGAAENPSLSEGMWMALAELGAPWVLRKIAGSDRAPPSVLPVVVRQVSARLADDWTGDEDVFDLSDVADVLESLADNPRSPAEVLAEVVRLNREIPRDRRGDYDEALAKHPNAPASLLAALARSGDDSVREAVAAHPRTAAEVLESLAGDAEWNVREAVARRTELSPGTLKRLGGDTDSSVSEAARANPNYPRFSLFKMLFGG